MVTLLYIIVATVSVSLISFVGALTLSFSKKNLEKILLVLVALAAGGLLGGAFLHLIPEALHEFTELHGHDASSILFLFVLIGFCLFLLTEQFLHWHHGHHGEHCCGDVHHKGKKKELSTMILFGDGMHNLIDGLVIGAAFMVSLETGIIATVAVMLHELPQEIGDFGVLVYSGMTRLKALLFNFLSGLTAVAGGVIAFFFSNMAQDVALYILPIAAGGFIYLAASDLIPEIKHGKDMRRMALHFGVMVLGIALMYLLLHVPFLEDVH